MANETTITAEPDRLDYFITREFEAPRELVVKAFTDPELVLQWLGPSRLMTSININMYKGESFHTELRFTRFLAINNDMFGEYYGSSLTIL